MKKIFSWVKGRGGHNYRSELDLFLEAFNAARRLEPYSRIQERKNHQKVVKQRDEVGAPQDDAQWRGF